MVEVCPSSSVVAVLWVFGVPLVVVRLVLMSVRLIQGFAHFHFEDCGVSSRWWCVIMGPRPSSFRRHPSFRCCSVVFRTVFRFFAFCTLEKTSRNTHELFVDTCSRYKISYIWTNVNGLWLSLQSNLCFTNRNTALVRFFLQTVTSVAWQVWESGAGCSDGS